MRVSTVQCYPPIILRKKQGIELTSSTEQRATEGIKAAFRDSGPAALKKDKTAGACDFLLLGNARGLVKLPLWELNTLRQLESRKWIQLIMIP